MIAKPLSSAARSQKYELNTKSALLLFSYEKEPAQCVYFANEDAIPSTAKLPNTNNLTSVKYVGGQTALNRLKEHFPNLKISREVIVTESLTAYFFAETGKVKMERVKTAPVLVKKKQVLVIDDSPTVQKLLVRIINSSNSMEVFNVANNAEMAKRIIETTKPDLITLDIHMPGLSGVDFLKTFLKFKKIPTIMISSVSINEGPLVLEALSNGASTYIQKPSIDRLNQVAPRIIDELETVASRPVKTFNLVDKTRRTFSDLDRIIAIGSSTGGTEALRILLSALPDQIPPILIVQHIPAVFSKALADRLNTLCAFQVKEAEHGEEIKKNTVYVAPGGKQLKIAQQGAKGFLKVNDDPPVNRFKPSVDYMFQSLAKSGLKVGAGIILTGMGKDGAAGLLELRGLGAATLTQDEESSIVYGMPKEAFKIGASEQSVNIIEMADAIVKAYERKRP